MRGCAFPLVAVALVFLALPASAQVAAEHNFAGGVGSCQGCHGARGDSEDGSIPRLNGQQADYIISRVGQILDLPSQPAGSDIAQLAAKLDQSALTSIAQYFARQTPSPTKPGSLAQAGKRIYENGDPARFVMACKACHGASGEGHGATPRLSGQHAQYLERQLRLFSSGQRENRLMHFNTLDLSDQDIDALISYLAGD